VLAFTSDRPARAQGARGKWTALMLALFVNLLFIAVLVFSVSWQNRKPEAVSAELYAPPPPPRPQPKVERPPQPKAEPPPEPKPVAKPPPPVVEKPDTTEADIALKAKRDAERKQQVEAERRQQQQLEAERERARQEAEAKQAEEKRQADARARQQQQMDALKAQADREARLRAQASRESQLRAQAERESQMRAQAERESQLRAQADQEARGRAAQAAAGAARNKAQLDWIDRIRSRIRPNINIPPDIPGNPEAIFDVVQLPTGEIIDVKLRKSSGVRAYDDAVQRGILKSSPLPKPVPADLFQRSLELRFRPLDQ
jgi:colicin import membrane protein